MNTYVTAEEAHMLLSSRLHARAWVEAPEDQREQALATAARAVDRLKFRGRKATPGQAMQFPRARQGEVPQVVKLAQCEEALALLDRGDSKRRKLQAEGVTSFSVGSLSESYAGAPAPLLSPEALAYLQPFRATSVPIR